MRDLRPSNPDPEPDDTGALRRDSDGVHARNWASETGAEDLDCPGETAPADVEPLRLPPLSARRHTPWLLVEVDGSAPAQGALVWALREAARREATVLAVTVLA